MSHTGRQRLIVSFLIVVLIATASVGTSQAQVSTCQQQPDACTCIAADGTQINLHPISPTDGSPAFVASQDGNPPTKFYWNPCSPLNICDGRPDVAVCQEQNFPDKDVHITAGYLTSGKFSKVGIMSFGLAYITEERNVEISMHCTDTPGHGEFRFLDENPTNTYNFDFLSRFACFNTTPPNPDDGGGWSLGDVLLLVAFCLIVLYLIVGACYNIFYKKLRGIQVAPNLIFWLAVPGLIKEGVMFLVGLCRGNRGQYGQI